MNYYTRGILQVLLFLPILFIIGTSYSFAQLEELEVIELSTPDRIAVFVDYPDEAVVIIKSSLTNLKFDSNIGLVNEVSAPDEGEYRLIIRPFRQIISVQAEGFIQLRFNVIPSGARDVSYYEVKPKTIIPNLIPVNIIVQNSGTSLNSSALIYIDDKLVENESNTFSLSPGKHALRIDAGIGFKEITDEIDVNSANTYFPYEVEELDLIQFSITSNPPNATLFIENEVPKNTPYGDFRFPGEYQVQMILEGYEPFEQSIVIKEGVDNVFNFELEEVTTRLILDINQEGAEIRINRVDYTGRNSIPLSPGLYRLEIFKEGYELYTEQFQIAKDQEIERSVTLTQLTGILQFSVFPIDANVTLRNSGGDIMRQWSGQSRNEIPIGEYTIESTRINHDTIIEEIKIFKDSVSSVQIEMIQTEGLGSLELFGLTGTSASLTGETNYHVNNLPADLETIQYGEYTLTAKKNGFVDINEKIEFRQPTMSLDLLDYYEPKSKTSAFNRSLFIPGGGQLYLDQKRGFLYLIGEVGLIGWAINSHRDYQIKEDDYSAALRSYQNATSNFDVQYEVVLNRLNSKNSAIKLRNTLIAGFVGLKSVELLDLLFFTKNPEKQLERAKELRLQANDKGVGVRYNF